MNTNELEINRLRELCDSKARERYGDAIPPEVTERLEHELKIIAEKGHSRAYLLAYEVTNKCRQLSAPFVIRGCAGASLAAFILGITHTNPLPIHLYCSKCGFADFEFDKYYDGDGGENALEHCGFDLLKRTCPKCGNGFKGDGHDIPFETFTGLYGEKSAMFDIDVPNEHGREIDDFIVELLENDELLKAVSDEQFVESYNSVHIIGNPFMGLFNKLQDVTGVYENNILYDGDDFYEFFKNGVHKAVPLLDEIPDELIDKLLPTGWFSDLIDLLGLYHGSAETGKAGRDPLYKAEINIVHRDDVMQTMMYYGFEREKAYHIMETVRRGKASELSEDDINEMKQKGVPDEYISDLKKIRYLFPRAHNAEFAIKLYKLMWYNQNFPEEYERAIKEYWDAKYLWFKKGE